MKGSETGGFDGQSRWTTSSMTQALRCSVALAQGGNLSE